MSKYKGNCVEIRGIHYIIGDCIGEGGNGCVFTAYAEGDSNAYAIKFLKVNELKNSTKKARFDKEIRFCEETDHPNILHIYGHGEYKGRPCYVMPQFQKSLRDIIENESSMACLFRYAIQLCDAVKYIHNQGIIHRDIKPENILVGVPNKLVLADFGIAHFADSIQTKTGDWLGNKGYFAPEQLPNEDAKDVTKACDIYAIGAVINELFTKKNPTGSKYITISEVIPVLAPLDELVFRCRMQNPEERPTIDEVCVRLRLILGELQNNIDELYEWLSVGEKANLSDEQVERILERACQDIISANYVFRNISDDLLEKYNLNYHMDIHYCLDESTRNLFFQRKLLQLCQRKFDYEAQVYKTGDQYTALNLSNEDEREIYRKLECILEKYPVDTAFDSVTGRVLKLFSSCCDYHCTEILRGITRLEKETEDLMDAPIFYIIYKLRRVIDMEEAAEIDIADHVLIQWHLSKFNEDGEEPLFDEEDLEEKQVLAVFEEKWGIIYSKIDSNHYSITFKKEVFYKRFREFALEFAKPYYVFEGDVLDLLRILRKYNGIIELYPLNSFDITHTLANLLSIKNDYKL